MKITNLGDLVKTVANQDSIAIIDTKNEQHRLFSYRALSELADAVANGLASAGFKHKDRIVILSLNSVEVVATYLGILRLGGTVVFINANLPAATINEILNDSNACLIFSDRDVVSLLPVINFNNTFYPFLIRKTFCTATVSKDDIAVILYTSGSTGKSKGVMLSHETRIWSILNLIPDKNLDERQCSIISGPMYQMHGLTSCELMLVSARRFVLLPKFEVEKFMLMLKKYQVTSIPSVPAIFAMILKESVSPSYFDSVLHITLASAPVSKTLFREIKKYFRNSNVSIAYGLTEVGPGLFKTHPTLPTPEGSVGYPNPAINYRLVDGILQVRSPSMMVSYSDNRKSFTPDGFFITNDLFTVDAQGFYYFEGRADDMFVCGGNNIFPKQSELLLEEHPSVLLAITVGVDDEVKGGKPYSFVVLKPKMNATESELKEHLMQQLPYSHAPRKIWILDAMPLTASNKIDRLQLKATAKILLEEIEHTEIL